MMPTREHARRIAGILTVVVAASARCGSPPPAAKTLVSFGRGFDIKVLILQDARPAIVDSGHAEVLRVKTGHDAPWPGITIKAPGGSWDLSAYGRIAVSVKNAGTKPIRLYCRVDSPGGDGAKNCVTGNTTLNPHESKQLRVPLRRQLPAALSDKLFGMRGYPGGSTKKAGLDPSRITQLIFFLNHPRADHVFHLGTVVAEDKHEQGKWLSMTPDQFFPMIDRFGQFMHKDWPGKTRSEEDLKRAIDREHDDLAAHPGPRDRDRYGGWKNGPQLKATGFFYPTKYDGMWWLVDPEGRLFWSHGADCVRFNHGTTPITDREFYYVDLPAADAPLAQFYGQGSWAPHGYYEDKGAYRTFNFSGANLMRKYGKAWYARAAERSHRRLRSWSMNTIANWSDARVYLMRKTPYVVSKGSHGAKPIQGSTGYWGKFPDPFDPSFRSSLERSMSRERTTSAGDPWCIGYFVDNELGWGDEVSLAKAALASPPQQAAKKAFLADLKKTYTTVSALNAAWGTEHDSWESLAASRTPPDEKRARTDLTAFYTRIAEEYFRTCREAVKQVAPNNLYLGCRFAWVNDRGARAAAKYCDVIGYNLYRDSVADFSVPEGIDMPVIVGEFHFGALDRGMFHTGLRPTADQQARADAYRRYVTGALKNPFLVGTHWFQYGDQATTGRGDGENYQIGLIDICDTPYPETIRAVREVGDTMYRTRRGAR